MAKDGKRLRKAYERACLSVEAMAALHPLLQASTLTVLEARWLGMDPGYASETLLAAQVRANGRKVVSLETVAQQRAALVPASAEEALSLLEQTLVQLEDQSGRRVLQRLATAWERGDLALLEDYDRWCECVSTEAEHKAGRRVFAAVGALHMTGEQSLPRLLAQRGFKVERVAFTR